MELDCSLLKMPNMSRLHSHKIMLYLMWLRIIRLYQGVGLMGLKLG